MIDEFIEEVDESHHVDEQLNGLADTENISLDEPELIEVLDFDEDFEAEIISNLEQQGETGEGADIGDQPSQEGESVQEFPLLSDTSELVRNCFVPDPIMLVK